MVLFSDDRIALWWSVVSFRHLLLYAILIYLTWFYVIKWINFLSIQSAISCMYIFHSLYAHEDSAGYQEIFSLVKLWCLKVCSSRIRSHQLTRRFKWSFMPSQSFPETYDDGRLVCLTHHLGGTKRTYCLQFHCW